MRSVPSSIYKSSYYLKMVGGKENYINGSVDKRLENAFDLADIKTDTIVLDLGTGRGEIATLCAKHKASVVAVDYSQEAVNMAEEFAKSALTPDELNLVRFQVADAKSLPFPDRYFDRVLFLEVLEHLYPEELQIVMNEIKRVMKDDGVLILSTGPNALLIRPIMWLGTLITGTKVWESRKYHVNEQSLLSLSRVLKDHGFSYKIKIGHTKNWLHSQVKEQKIGKFVKIVTRLISISFDVFPLSTIRRLPGINVFLGTDFLCFCQKSK